MSKSNVNEDSDCVERCLRREASEVGNREEKVRDGSYVCGLSWRMVVWRFPVAVFLG